MLRPGDQVAPLTLSSAGGASLALASLASQRCLLWYEDRDSGEQNRPLREALSQQRDRSGHAADLTILAIADLRAFDWFPARRIVGAAVRQLERAQRTPIYCDWTGAIGDALAVTPGQSHLLLLGPGLRVERAFAGPIAAADRAAIVAATAPLTVQPDATGVDRSV